MSSDHVVLRRHTSDIRAQYVHAVYSTVQIDGENDIQQDVDIAIDPSLLAPLPPVPSQFGSERRVLDHIQLRQTKMASELEARERKREIYVQNRMRREAVERAKKEEEDRVAATRAASQLAQEELRRKQQEEDRAKQDQHLLRSLNAEKAIILRHFDGVVGIESDLKVRVSFLERFKWNLESAVAAFFEYEGDIANVPPPPSPVQPSPASSSSKAYIQFQFPSNNVEAAEFNVTDTLWIIFAWVYERAQAIAKGQEFSLSSADLRVFQEADYDRTLQELNLCPSGKVIVRFE